MAKQSLNRLDVFAVVDQKGREALAEVVELESLTRLKPDADLNSRLGEFYPSPSCLRSAVFCPSSL
jgi:hypothetical protein